MPNKPQIYIHTCTEADSSLTHGWHSYSCLCLWARACWCSCWWIFSGWLSTHTQKHFCNVSIQRRKSDACCSVSHFLGMHNHTFLRNTNILSQSVKLSSSWMLRVVMREDGRSCSCSLLHIYLHDWWRQLLLWGCTTNNVTNALNLERIYHDTIPHVDTWPASVSVALCACMYAGACCSWKDLHNVSWSCTVVMFAAPQWVCTWTWRLFLAVGQPASGRQTNRGIGWPGNRTCLCSSSSWSWNLKSWGPKKRRDELPSLEQRQSLIHQGHYLHMCECVSVLVSVHKSESGNFLLSLYNHPINFNLSFGTSSQCKSNKSLYGAGVCLRPAQVSAHTVCVFVECVCTREHL